MSKKPLSFQKSTFWCLVEIIENGKYKAFDFNHFSAVFYRGLCNGLSMNKIHLVSFHHQHLLTYSGFSRRTKSWSGPFLISFQSLPLLFFLYKLFLQNGVASMHCQVSCYWHLSSRLLCPGPGSLSMSLFGAWCISHVLFRTIFLPCYNILCFELCYLRLTSSKWLRLGFMVEPLFATQNG